MTTSHRCRARRDVIGNGSGPLTDSLRPVETSEPAAWPFSSARVVGPSGPLSDLPFSSHAASRSLDLAQAERWTAFIPWPESFIAEAHLLDDRLEEARSTLEHAYPLACHLQDPCWEGVTSRALGLLEAAEGNGSVALSSLTRAVERGRAYPDAYRWVFAYSLDALAEIAVRFDDPNAADWVAELEAVAGRHGIRELIVSARIHAARLGEPGAEDGARVMAEGIDNPYLRSRLEGLARPVG